MKKSVLKVWLDQNILIELLKEFHLHFPKETGGVIMGYKVGSDYQICYLIGPGPKAVHNARSFTPDDDFHQSEIAAIYNSSGGKITYLGDWHTHPNERAYLSELDKSTLKKIANYRPARLPKPLMLIVGSTPFEIRCWRYKQRTLTYNRFELMQLTISKANK